MIGILKKRFKEISHRGKVGIKARWFEPLNYKEMEKLGIDAKNEDTGPL